MTWREDLRRVKFADGRELVGATFRGVPFFVDESERAGGRRTVKHEFFLKDDPFYEDLGRAAREFRITGYVLGDDYLTARDALLVALEDTSGPGTLVHPYYGIRIVICETLGVREARAEGGVATFTLAFAETPAQSPSPTDVVDSADQASASADAANTAADVELAAKYNAAGLAGFAFASAETALKNAAAALRDKLAPVITATQEAAQLNSDVTLLTAEASSLVRLPAVLIDKLRTAVTALVDATENAPGAVMQAMIDAYAVDLGPIVDATTGTRARELVNQTALTAAIRRVVAIQAARIAPTVPFATIDDALAARATIAAMLDDQAALADDDAYGAIVDLRAQVLQAVPGASAFASIVTVTRNVPIPSLLLAYQLYGSVDLADDIIARNDIRHPGFVVGSLKVLSNG